MRTRQRLEQAKEIDSRINRSLEELVKENEEKEKRFKIWSEPDEIPLE